MKQTTLNITYFNPKDHGPEDIFRKDNIIDFLYQDILGTLLDLNLNTQDVRIVNIINHEGSVEEVTQQIREVIDHYNNDNTVIITSAYISTVEFSRDKYYIDGPYLKEEDKIGKEEIPVDEILERECNLLYSLGFINVNYYTQYELKEAFIYGNTIGTAIADKMKDYCNDNEAKENLDKKGE